MFRGLLYQTGREIPSVHVIWSFPPHEGWGVIPTVYKQNLGHEVPDESLEGTQLVSDQQYFHQVPLDFTANNVHKNTTW